MEDLWYENYEFDANPLETDPIVDEPRQLLGREDEEKEVIYRILSSNMLFIEGVTGQGKTALLRHAIENFRGHGKVIYVDSEKVNKAINVEELLINANRFRGGVMGKKPKNMILLLDNIESMSPRNWERIKYYFDQNYLKSVIFTGKNYTRINFPKSIQSRIGSRVIKLGKLSKSEAIQIIQDRLGEDYEEILRDEEILMIYEHSSQNLKNFLNNCFKIAQYKHEKNKETLKSDEIKKAIESEIIEDEDLAEEKELANICLACGSKLKKVGEYYRCPSCDTFCDSCGAIVGINDERCPECKEKFE